MARAPEPGDCCRPGGSCAECNCGPPVCQWCGETEVQFDGDLCDECGADRADDEDVNLQRETEV